MKNKLVCQLHFVLFCADFFISTTSKVMGETLGSYLTSRTFLITVLGPRPTSLRSFTSFPLAVTGKFSDGNLMQIRHDGSLPQSYQFHVLQLFQLTLYEDIYPFSQKGSLNKLKRKIMYMYTHARARVIMLYAYCTTEVLQNFYV